MGNNKVILSWLGVSPKDKIVNVVLILIVLVAVYFIVRYAYKQLKDTLFSGEKNELKKEIESGSKLSYSNFEYNNMAKILQAAMEGAGTDNDTIYSIFYKMNTRADVLQLVVAFATREGENLSQWLRSEWFLSVDKINEILTSKGIDYSF
jgi:hypothetical protein